MSLDEDNMTVAYYNTVSTDSLAMSHTFNGQYIYLSTPESYENSHTAKQKRVRKVHAKVRTGCLTCKARRKKCDEAKPACLACTSTGRQCDGYQSDLRTRMPAEGSGVATLGKSESRRTAPSHRDHFDGNGKAVLAWWTPAATPVETKQIDALDTSFAEPHETNDQSITPAENLNHLIPDASDNFDARRFRSTSVMQSPSSIINGNSAGTPSSVAALDTSYRPRSILPAKYATVPNMLITPSTYRQVTDLERHCFSFFRYQTAPSFASYFNFALFRAGIIQAALDNSVVMSCAAALGAVHRRHEYGISREAFEYCIHASSLHQEALKKLAAYKANSLDSNGWTKPYCRDAIALSEILLSLFESFQGEHEKTVEHVYEGMKQLLERPMTLVHKESHYRMVGPASNVLPRLFHRLDYSAHLLFEAPPLIYASQSDERPLPLIPSMFASLEEARDYIFTELHWIRSIPIKLWQDPIQKRKAQILHVRRISQWSVSYAELIKTITGTPKRNRACKMMKLTRSTVYLILYLMLSVEHLHVDPSPSASEIDHLTDQDPNQPYTTNMLWELISQREDLVASLTSINIMAESNLDEMHTFHYEEHSLSLDSAVGPPRGSEKVPESSGKIRHMVKYLNLEQTPDHELWSTMGMYGVAEKWTGLEEHAVINAVKAIIPETLDPKWVDVSWMMESRKLLLRYCRPDDLGLVWTQEWWKF